jgi:hypothetical protein
MNLKIIALEIKPNILDNLRIIWVEKKHNAISNQKISYKIKNGYYPIFPLFVPEGIIWELRVTKGIRTFPIMLARIRLTLSLGLTCTLVGKSKNQQAIEMEIMRKC